MEPTKLEYLEDFNVLEKEARVLEVRNEEGREVVVLDATILYPQGGGQPYDQGVLESVSGKFVVEEVRFVDGVVKHIGKFERGRFGVGEIVNCRVDRERRALNSHLHSGGHVVDLGVTELKLGWIPGKGYHFPDGPYVEYIGTFEESEKEKLRAAIEEAGNKCISEGRETKLLFMYKEQMRAVCHHVPDYVPEGKPARVVMYGDFGVPCGGTHVSNLREIGHLTIRKIKAGGGKIKVSYDVAR